jgi:hypothetical protein
VIYYFLIGEKINNLARPNFSSMISNSLLTLTSVSQWGLFLGIASILFGWVEKRETFVVAGQVVFLAVGLMAAWILFTDQIIVPEMTNGIIPKQARVLSYFKGVAVFSGYAFACLLLKLFEFRYQKISLYILLFFAMMLFFMVFNIQQMAG